MIYPNKKLDNSFGMVGVCKKNTKISINRIR